MTLPNLDELERVRFVWPEPLVIELICDQYTGRVPVTQRLALAKLHEHMLRGLVEVGEDAALRRKVVSLCGAYGLDADSIARIDHAVFFELIRLVGMRFRNSPRLRTAYGERLQAALAQITIATKPDVRPASIAPTTNPKNAFVSRWRPRSIAA